MPIRSIKSKRRGCKPLVFFKGSPAEARENAEKLLSKAFQTAKINLPAQEIRSIKHYFVNAIEDPKRQIVYIPTSVGRIVLRIKDLKNGIVCVYQRPAIHGVRKRKSARGKEIDSFEALKKILKSGFRTVSEKTNVFTGSGIKTASPHESEKKKTMGDKYSLKLMSTVTYPYMTYAHVKAASTSQIAAVNIRLVQGLSEKEIAARKRFYRRQIFKKFDIPVHFT